MNGISVIICCYNSATRLPATIQHLAQQNVPVRISWEVLIIDNASTDDTGSVALKEWNKYNCNAGFCIVREEKAGLNHARICGVTAAQYECIVFCDDDNWLDEKYVDKAFAIMNANTRIGALGGQSKPAFETVDVPAWFEQEKGSYAVGKQAPHTGDISAVGNVWGAGQVTRRPLYLKAFTGHPSILSGRKGSGLSSGDDTEYCCRLLLMNYILYYDESLQFTHYIPQQRLTDSYKSALHKAFSESHVVTVMYHLMMIAKRSSFMKKSTLLGKAMVKYFISSAKLFHKTTPAYERMMLYFLTGSSFIKVSPEAKAIYRFAQAAGK